VSYNTCICLLIEVEDLMKIENDETWHWIFLNTVTVNFSNTILFSVYTYKIIYIFESRLIIFAEKHNEIFLNK